MLVYLILPASQHYLRSFTLLQLIAVLFAIIASLFSSIGNFELQKVQSSDLYNTEIKKPSEEMVNEGVIENSTDLIGLHFPSVGVGFGVILVVIVFLLVVLCCARKCWAWASSTTSSGPATKCRHESISFYRSNPAFQPQPAYQPFPMLISTGSFPQQTPQNLEMDVFFSRLNRQLDQLEHRNSPALTYNIDQPSSSSFPARQPQDGEITPKDLEEPKKCRIREIP